MRHHHESGKGWSPEDGVVLRGPVDDLEFDLLLSEVRGGAKMTSKCITPRGYVGFPGTIPWKDVSVGRRSFIGILMFRSVSA
jgi:hypothetical protein